MDYVRVQVEQGLLPHTTCRERDTIYISLLGTDIEIPFVIPSIVTSTEMSHRLFQDTYISDIIVNADNVYLYVAPPGTVCYIPHSTPAQTGNDVVIYAMDMGSSSAQQILVLTGPGYSIDSFLGSFATYIPSRCILVNEDKYLFVDYLNMKPMAPYERSTLIFAKSLAKMNVYGSSRDGVEVRGLLDMDGLIARSDQLTLQLSEMYSVPDISGRNALVLGGNSIVTVGDASGDPDITSGYASYFWNHATSTWTLTYASENEGMSVEFSMLGFVSTAGDIDSAVSFTHQHTNADTIHFIQESNSNLSFNGIELQEGWPFSVIEW